LRRGAVTGRHLRPPAPSLNRSRAAVIRSLVGALALSVVLIGWGSSQATVPTTAPPPSLEASQSAPAPAVAAAQSTPAPAPAPGSPPVHITYAAAGMNQPVLPLTPTEEERSLAALVPPHTADAYWLTSYGVPGAGSTNTTYVVGHSWEGRESPFNNISSLAKPGDRLTLTTAEGPLEYTIDRITTEYKDTLRDSPIWDKVPGRLILITCFTEDLWGKNIIVQASPLPAS
jgi:hypothetical protein